MCSQTECIHLAQCDGARTGACASRFRLDTITGGAAAFVISDEALVTRCEARYVQTRIKRDTAGLRRIVTFLHYDARSSCASHYTAWIVHRADRFRLDSSAVEFIAINVFHVTVVIGSTGHTLAEVIARKLNAHCLRRVVPDLYVVTH